MFESLSYACGEGGRVHLACGGSTRTLTDPQGRPSGQQTVELQLVNWMLRQIAASILDTLIFRTLEVCVCGGGSDSPGIKLPLSPVTKL